VKFRILTSRWSRASRARRRIAVAASAALAVTTIGAAGAVSASAAISAPVELLVDDWKYAGVQGSESLHQCGADEVIVGMVAPQLDNQEQYPWVRCAFPSVAGHPELSIAALGDRSHSEWLLPGDTHISPKELGHDCADAPMLAAVHVQGGRYASSQFRCRALTVNARSAELEGAPLPRLEVDRTWQSDLLDTDRGRFEFDCPSGMAITGRDDLWRQHGANAQNRVDAVRFTCASWKVVTK
jgi:hypothetical protein